jgi:hypothetical protein
VSLDLHIRVYRQMHQAGRERVPGCLDIHGQLDGADFFPLLGVQSMVALYDGRACECMIGDMVIVRAESSGGHGLVPLAEALK